MLKKINIQSAAKIQEMLSYKPGSVARYMDHLVVTVPQTMTVEEVMSYIRSLQNILIISIMYML